MRPLVLLCVLALSVAACGAESRDSTEDFTGDERAVATAVEDLESAARDDDSEAVCTKLLAETLLTRLEQRDANCESAVNDAFDDADSLDLTVDDVTISGDTARATVTSGTGANKKTDTLELEKVGAAWRITSL